MGVDAATGRRDAGGRGRRGGGARGRRGAGGRRGDGAGRWLGKGGGFGVRCRRLRRMGRRVAGCGWVGEAGKEKCERLMSGSAEEIRAERVGRRVRK